MAAAKTADLAVTGVSVRGMLGGLLLALLAAPATGQHSTTVVYRYRGADIALEMRLDSLGVIPHDTADAGHVAALLGTIGATPAGVTPGGVWRFALAAPVSEADLWMMVRAVGGAPEGVIRRAGALLRHPDDAYPLLAGHPFLVRFREGVPADVIDSMNMENGVVILRTTGSPAHRWLLAATAESPTDPIQLARQYDLSALTVWAQPDFSGGIRDAGSPDPFIGEQWHLPLIGAENAWTHAPGDPTVTIAVLEEGSFEATHPDLAPNVVGTFDAVMWVSTLGTTGLAHGTASAGLVAAVRNNGIGTAGVCPHCTLLLVRGGPDVATMADAVYHARTSGASVISSSWSVRRSTAAAIEDEYDEAAATGRGGRGIVILQAMDNIGAGSTLKDRCTASGIEMMAAAPSAIGIGSSTDQDKRAVHSSEGPCLELLAPGASHHPSGPPETRWGVTTTDESGSGGYNSARQGQTVGFPETECPWAPGSGELADDGYTRCYGGNSAATAIAAGVVGLMLSRNPGLYYGEVAAILHTTAVKIDPGAAGYVPAPPDPMAYSTTHGYGRIDALAAVEEAGTVIGTDAECVCPGDPEGWGGGVEPAGTVVSAMAIEVGTRAGMTVVNGAGTETTVNLPGSGPLAHPVLYAAWFPGGGLEIQLQAGGAVRTRPAQPDERTLVLALQPAWFLASTAGASVFLGPSLALRTLNVGGAPTTTDWGAGAALGYRIMPFSFLAIRFEARYRNWWGPEIDEYGAAVTFGVVLN